MAGKNTNVSRIAELGLYLNHVSLLVPFLAVLLAQLCTYIKLILLTPSHQAV